MTPTEPTPLEQDLGVRCVPLCGASNAYGPRDEWWRHEPQCPVRQAYEAREGR